MPPQHATTTGTNALLASWIIDSGTTNHMSSTRDLFTSLSQLSVRSVSIANGGQCSIGGEGVVQASSQLPFENVLFVSNFPINLLSINAITKSLHCKVSFFPYHCVL